MVFKVNYINLMSITWGVLEQSPKPEAHDRAGLEIATHWSPMRPKIECWRLDFHNWSPAGDSCFVR